MNMAVFPRHGNCWLENTCPSIVQVTVRWSGRMFGRNAPGVGRVMPSFSGYSDIQRPALRIWPVTCCTNNIDVRTFLVRVIPCGNGSPR